MAAFKSSCFLPGLLFICPSHHYHRHHSHGSCKCFMCHPFPHPLSPYTTPPPPRPFCNLWSVSKGRRCLIADAVAARAHLLDEPWRHWIISRELKRGRRWKVTRHSLLPKIPGNLRPETLLKFLRPGLLSLCPTRWALDRLNRCSWSNLVKPLWARTSQPFFVCAPPLHGVILPRVTS